MGSDDASEMLRKAGWRQGDIVPPEANATLIDACIDQKPVIEADACRLTIMSHECDIVRPVDKEPFVELIVGCPTVAENGLCLNCRNPRTLCLPLGKAWITYSVHDRFRIPKAALASPSLCPDDSLAPDEAQRQVLRTWIARRYTRAAFPDEFIQRMEKQQSRLDKILKSPAAKPISCIFVSGADEEMSADQNYRITVLLAVPEGMAIPDNKFEQKFADILDDCPGIVVDDVQALPEHDIPLSVLGTHKRLDFDFRSPPGDHDAARPPDANL